MTEAKHDLRIAVLSDTHGLLRPEVLGALADVDHILHAGDVGNINILEQLGQIAAVTAIRGNVDTAGPCATLPATEMVELSGTFFHLLHDLTALDLDPVAAGINAVIYGHTHQPAQRRHNGVLYLNPGSIGPRRFRLPVAMAFLTVNAGELQVESRRFDL